MWRALYTERPPEAPLPPLRGTSIYRQDRHTSLDVGPIDRELFLELLDFGVT
jgi:hypothetical protein